MPDHDEVQVMTVSAQVYAELRQTILSGRYAPGTQLTLRTLADQLGTSITPVREAVHRLAAEHAVVLSPNRSIRIPELTQHEVDHLWRLRILVEGDVCFLAAGRATVAQLDTIEALNAAAAHSYRARKLESFLTKISTIGQLLAESAGAELHADLIGNLRLRSGPHIAMALGQESSSAEAFVSFTTAMVTEFITALRERDGERARDARRVDIQTFQRFIFDRLGWKRT